MSQGGQYSGSLIFWTGLLLVPACIRIGSLGDTGASCLRWVPTRFLLKAGGCCPSGEPQRPPVFKRCFMDQGSLFSLALESPSRCVVDDCGWFSTGVSWCDRVYAACTRMGSEASWMITGCLPSGVDMGRLLEGPGCKEAHFIDPLAKQVSLWFCRTSTCTRPLEICSMFTPV